MQKGNPNVYRIVSFFGHKTLYEQMYDVLQFSWWQNAILCCLYLMVKSFFIETKISSLAFELINTPRLDTNKPVRICQYDSRTIFFSFTTVHGSVIH